MKKITVILVALMCVSLLSAQARRAETTAEEEYLSSVDEVVINELAKSDDRQTKLAALEYATAAIREGRGTDKIREIVELLAGEGILTESRINGRIANNFAEVRAEACDLLGKIASPGSKMTLRKIAYVDSEPMVATAAIRALGDIGLGGDDSDTIATIAWVEKRYALVKPVSALALEVLNAYEKLAPAAAKIADEDQRRVQLGIMRISISEISKNNRYILPVRNKATEMLRTFKS